MFLTWGNEVAVNINFIILAGVYNLNLLTKIIFYSFY
jgi:hypothetical protein